MPRLWIGVALLKTVYPTLSCKSSKFCFKNYQLEFVLNKNYSTPGYLYLATIFGVFKICCSSFSRDLIIMYTWVSLAYQWYLKLWCRQMRMIGLIWKKTRKFDLGTDPCYRHQKQGYGVTDLMTTYWCVLLLGMILSMKGISSGNHDKLSLNFWKVMCDEYLKTSRRTITVFFSFC